MVSGARSAPGNFLVWVPKNLKHHREIKHFRRAKRSGKILDFGIRKPWKLGSKLRSIRWHLLRSGNSLFGTHGQVWYHSMHRCRKGHYPKGSHLCVSKVSSHSDAICAVWGPSLRSQRKWRIHLVDESTWFEIWHGLYSAERHSYARLWADVPYMVSREST